MKFETLAVGIMSIIQSVAGQSSAAEYCRVSGAVSDGASQYSTLDDVNSELSPLLNELVQRKFFRYYKVNLNKGCNFWQNDMKCSRPDCAVEELDDMDVIPKHWEGLGKVDFSSSSPMGLSPFQSCDYSTKDFCIIDDESRSDGVYVDLRKNPERFTGYDGESAARIWRAIYRQDPNRNHTDTGLTNRENCFSQPSSPRSPLAVAGNEECLEKRVYYRVISGLHSSISTHICREKFDPETGEWGADLDCYLNRVGKFPERLENIYFAYALGLRALAKISPYLESYDFCTGDMSNQNMTKASLGYSSDYVSCQTLVDKVLKEAHSSPKTFDETLLFTSKNKVQLKREFKEHFRNVSRIMDCVSCEKCRLWGKLQTSGIGTALKILFSYSPGAKDYSLTRGEIVSLFNAIARLSESLKARKMFLDMLLAREAVQASRKNDHTKGVWSEEYMAMYSEHVLLINPVSPGMWILGLTIIAAGVLRFFANIDAPKKKKNKSE